MRSLGVMGVMVFAVAPVFGDGVFFYDFEVISGTLTVDISPDGLTYPDPVTVELDGAFEMAIYQDHAWRVETSDAFVLGSGNPNYPCCWGPDIYNTDRIEIPLMGVVTANVAPGDVHFRDFAMVAPGHVGYPDIHTDVYLEIAASATGMLNTTLDTSGWANQTLDFKVDVSTGWGSQGLFATIRGTFGYELGITAITQTITLDLIVEVVGTAHVAPDPALSGFAALGLSGAGAWLRRRR